MADTSLLKRWPDGRPVIVTALTDTEAHVQIGGEYKILPLEHWRELPVWDEERG